MRCVSSTLMPYLLYRSEALEANIHIHSILPNSIIVNTCRQRENPKDYIMLRPITVAEPCIIESLLFKFPEA